MSTLVEVTVGGATGNAQASPTVAFPKGLELGAALVSDLDVAPESYQVAVMSVLEDNPLPRVSLGLVLRGPIRDSRLALKTAATKALLAQAHSAGAGGSDSTAKQLLAELLETHRFETYFAAEAPSGLLSLGLLLLAELPLLLKVLPSARATQLITAVAALARGSSIPSAIAATEALTVTIGASTEDIGMQAPAGTWVVPDAILGAVSTSQVHRCDYTGPDHSILILLQVHEVAVVLCVSLPSVLVWQTHMQTGQPAAHAPNVQDGEDSMAYVDATSRLINRSAHCQFSPRVQSSVFIWASLLAV